jgi:hypothetical protein
MLELVFKKFKVTGVFGDYTLRIFRAPNEANKQNEDDDIIDDDEVSTKPKKMLRRKDGTASDTWEENGVREIMYFASLQQVFTQVKRTLMTQDESHTVNELMVLLKKQHVEMMAEIQKIEGMVKTEKKTATKDGMSDNKQPVQVVTPEPEKKQTETVSDAPVKAIQKPDDKPTKIRRKK